MKEYPRLRGISIPESMYTDLGQARIHAALRAKLVQAMESCEEIRAYLRTQNGGDFYLISQTAVLKHHLDRVKQYANCLGSIEGTPE